MGGWAARRALSAFAGFACRFWLLVFPCARCEVRLSMRRAARVPDPELRRLAVETLGEEQGNLEGAASFGSFLPRRTRGHALRALVAFQAIFDYVDTLAEQPSADPAANGEALHEALLVALTPGRSHPDYYAHHPLRDDGGYLRSLVDRCRDAFAALPSHALVQEAVHRGVRRMIAYQTLIHRDDAGENVALVEWARGETPAGSGLGWWETAAGGASSLVAFALIAAAARPHLTAHEVAAIEAAYFPWVGALHVLLDSLVDRPSDVATGHHSIADHYASPAEAAVRIDGLARTAVGAVGALPGGHQHVLLLAGMAGFYVAKPTAHQPHASVAAERVAASLGALARPVLLVHRIRLRLSKTTNVNPEKG